MMADAAADVNLTERLRDEERAYSVRLRQPNGKVSGKMHAYVGGMAVSVFATSRAPRAGGSKRVGSRTGKPVATFVLEHCRFQLLEVGLAVYSAADDSEVTLLGSVRLSLSLSLSLSVSL